MEQLDELEGPLYFLSAPFLCSRFFILSPSRHRLALCRGVREARRALRQLVLRWQQICAGILPLCAGGTISTMRAQAGNSTVSSMYEKDKEPGTMVGIWLTNRVLISCGWLAIEFCKFSSHFSSTRFIRS